MPGDGDGTPVPDLPGDGDAPPRRAVPVTVPGLLKSGLIVLAKRPSSAKNAQPRFEIAHQFEDPNVASCCGLISPERSGVLSEERVAFEWPALLAYTKKRRAPSNSARLLHTLHTQSAHRTALPKSTAIPNTFRKRLHRFEGPA
jgi:hypothetical protein